jgi:hypothetical protein
LALAKVCWITDKNGSYINRSRGTQFATVARFAEDKTWPQEAWSLVLEFNDADHDSKCMHVNVHFLVENAPAQLLHAGSHFELLAGRRVIATGEILAS